MRLPPEVSAPPLAQTLRWVFRPISFMEDCRRRYGGEFCVRFTGFETPMVLVSDPNAVKAIYSERVQRAASGAHRDPRAPPRPRNRCCCWKDAPTWPGGG